MEVGESVSSSLRRILTKKVLVAVKPATAEEKGNLSQRVDAIIQNATEVRLDKQTDGSLPELFFFSSTKLSLRKPENNSNLKIMVT